MINEEIARKTLNMEINAGKVTGKGLLNLLKKTGGKSGWQRKKNR